MPTFRDALVLAQAEEMRANEDVFVFGLDVPDHKKIFGSTTGLLEEFGEKRCFGTPLSEDAMTGVALGAALSGLRPIHVHIRVDFLLLAMNQLANMIAPMRYLSGGKHKVPLVIRAVVGRGWGQGAQHSKTLHSVFAHIPGIKVVMPSTPQDAYSLLRASIQEDNPVVFLEHRWSYDIEGEVDPNVTAEIGKAKVVREGKDLTIAAASWMVVEAIKAAKLLERSGLNVEVVDLRTIAPLDKDTLVQSVRKTGSLLVADYDWVPFGLGSECSAIVNEECFGELKKPVARMGFEFVPCPTTRPLEDEFYPNALKIIRRVEKMFDLSPLDLSGEEFYSYENKFKGPF